MFHATFERQKSKLLGIYCILRIANAHSQVRNNPSTPPLEIGSPVAPDDEAYYGGELRPRISGGGRIATASKIVQIYVISVALLIISINQSIYFSRSIVDNSVLTLYFYTS